MNFNLQKRRSTRTVIGPEPAGLPGDGPENTDDIEKTRQDLMLARLETLGSTTRWQGPPADGKVAGQQTGSSPSQQTKTAATEKPQPQRLEDDPPRPQQRQTEITETPQPADVPVEEEQKKRPPEPFQNSLMAQIVSDDIEAYRRELRGQSTLKK